ncbi:hypothetical protein D1872_276730 [compost metagenome]
MRNSRIGVMVGKPLIRYWNSFVHILLDLRSIVGFHIVPTISQLKSYMKVLAFETMEKFAMMN